MKRFFLAYLLFFLTGLSMLAQERIYLWPDRKMPNSKGLAITDSVENERVYQVARPSMDYFAPSPEKNTGAAVVIVPGGGYARLAYVVSGNDLAKWFNQLGMHAFVLWHRLPISPDVIQPELAPLQDIQRALRLIRYRAKEWGIQVDKVGAMGSSAGGHLVTTVGTHEEDVSTITDQLDDYSFRPDFMILVSPVVSLEDDLAHRGSRKNLLGENASDPELVRAFSNHLWVDETTPPTILFHANNDKTVSSLNSIRFYEAMKAHQRPASLHIFPSGGHSISLEEQPGTTHYWSSLLADWLRESLFIDHD